MVRFAALLACLLCLAPPAVAKIGVQQGLIAPDSIPASGKSKHSVLLDVPQVWQGDEPWCVPASVAMALTYYGTSMTPAKLKELAEGHKPAFRRNVWVTSWDDMQTGLRQIGAKWKIRHYPNTDDGFRQGLRDIQRALRRGRPVLIDVDLSTGHTFVVVGYDAEQQLLYFRDPLLKDGRMRVLSYETVRQNWHNRAMARTRSAFFTAP